MGERCWRRRGSPEGRKSTCKKRDECISRKGFTSASGSKGSSKSTLLPWLCKSFGSSLLVWPAVKAAGLGRGPMTGAFLGVSGGNTDNKTRFNLAIKLLYLLNVRWETLPEVAGLPPPLAHPG